MICPTDVDQSMLSCFQRCPRNFQWRYLRHLIPLEEPLPLIFGTAWHKALEVYYITYDTNRASEAFAASWGNQEGAANRNLDVARKMLMAREKQFEDDYIQVTSRETIFAVNMGDFTLRGRRDGLCKIKGKGQIWVLEFKHSARAPNFNWLETYRPDNQLYTYVFATQQELNCSGALVEYALAHPGKVDFQRGLIEVSNLEIADFVDSIKATYAYLQKCFVQNYFPMHPSSCSIYRGCEYRPLCAFPATIESTIANEFLVKPYNPPGVEVK